MNKLKLFIILIITSFNCSANNIDSLKEELKSADYKRVSDIINTLNLSVFNDSEIIELEEAVLNRLEFYSSNEQGILLGNLSFINYNLSNLTRSFLFLEKLKLVIPNVEDKKDKNLLRLTYNRNSALCYLAESNFEKSLIHFQKAQECALKSGDLEKEIQNYDDLGVYHFYIGDYSNSIVNWEESLKLKKNNLDSIEWSGVLGNLGYVYTIEKQYKKAEDILLLSLKIARTSQVLNDIYSVHTNLGNLYHKQNKYEKSLIHIKEAHNIVEQIGNKADIANSHSNLAVVLRDNGKNEEAEFHYFKGLELCKEINDLPLLKIAFQNIADKYQEDGNYKLAYAYMDTAWSFNDSILNSDRIAVLAEMENKYLGQKQKDSLNIALKEAEISKQNEAIANKDKKEQEKRGNLILIIAAVCLVGAGAVIVLILRNSKIREKANNELSHKNEIIEEKNKDITDSIKYAEKLQKAVLPPREKLNLNFRNFMLFYRPRDIVSGDFYWFYENEKFTYLAAADCTGHGVPGAMVSMLCTSQLNRSVQSNDALDSGQLLSAVNSGIIKVLQSQNEDYKATDGMDITLLRINKVNGDADYAGAMNKIIVVRNRETFDYAGDRVSIGGYTDVNYQFKTTSIDLIKGDCVYMFSDGFQDQFGGVKQKKFRLKSLKKLFVKISAKSAKEQEEILNDTLIEWQGNLERIDDVLVLGFTY